MSEKKYTANMKSLKQYITESIFDIDDKIDNFDDDIYREKVEQFCKKYHIKKYEILPDGKVNINGDLIMQIKNKKDASEMIDLNIVYGQFLLYLDYEIDFDLLPEYVEQLSLEGLPVSNHTFIIMHRGSVQLNVQNGDYGGLKIRYPNPPYIYPSVWGDSVDFFKGVTFENAQNIMIYPGKQANPIKMEKNIIDTINKRIKYIDADMLVYNKMTNRRYPTQKVYKKQGQEFKEVVK